MNELIETTTQSLKGNEHLRKKAASLYYSGKFYPTEIADYLNVDINELGFYIFGEDKTGEHHNCWFKKLESGNIPQFVSTYVEIKTEVIKKSESRTIDLVDKILTSIEGQEDFDTDDLKKVIESYEKLDKIGRLEEGKATTHSIQEVATYSLRDIVARKENKVEVVEDVTYKDITDDNK